MCNSYFYSVLYSVQNIAFSELVVRCQELIREFALDQLKQFGMSEKEAKLRAASSVSQRDIQVCKYFLIDEMCLGNNTCFFSQRVFTFYSWIVKTYEAFQM